SLMKKVVFMVINMNVGGTEKALLNMIDRMSVDKYDISILMLDKSGRLLNDVPKHVHIHHLQAYSIMKNILNDPFKQTLLHLLKKRKLTKSIVFTVIFILCKLFKTRSFL